MLFIRLLKLEEAEEEQGERDLKRRDLKAWNLLEHEISLAHRSN